jgi:hypothetical protein
MLSPIQKKVALAEIFSNVSSTNSVGPFTGPSSKVRYNSFLPAGMRQIREGKRSGRKKGIRWGIILHGRREW